MSQQNVNRPKDDLKAMVAAFQFLTRIKIPIEVPFESKILQRSVMFFPLVGLTLGIILLFLCYMLSLIMPPWPAAICIVLVWSLLTGGLHMDGLMDTADGVFSSRSQEKMLDIMKDSHVGAMGVQASILIILLKTSSLAFLLQNISQANMIEFVWLPLAMISATVWSRWWMVIAMSSWKTAKTSSIGKLFQGLHPLIISYTTVVALIIYLIPLMIHMVNNDKDVIYLMAAAAVPICVAVIGWFMARWLNRKLGGLTGDTYGAMNECLEALCLLLIVMAVYITS